MPTVINQRNITHNLPLIAYNSYRDTWTHLWHRTYDLFPLFLTSFTVTGCLTVSYFPLYSVVIVTNTLKMWYCFPESFQLLQYDRILYLVYPGYSLSWTFFVSSVDKHVMDLCQYSPTSVGFFFNFNVVIRNVVFYLFFSRVIICKEWVART